MGSSAIVSAWHGLQTKSDDFVLCVWEFTSTWSCLVNDHTSLPELLLSPTFAFIVIHTVVVPLVVLNRYQKVCWILMYNMHGFNFLYFLMEIWKHLIPNLKWWPVWKHGDFALVLLWLVLVYWCQLESWALSLNPAPGMLELLPYMLRSSPNKGDSNRSNPGALQQCCDRLWLFIFLHCAAT